MQLHRNIGSIVLHYTKNAAGLGKKILIENTFIGRRKLRLGSTKYFLNVNCFKYFIEPNKEPKWYFVAKIVLTYCEKKLF